MQEDIIAKLTDFLVAPHATTTVVLADKEVYFLVFQLFFLYDVMLIFFYQESVISHATYSYFYGLNASVKQEA